jgi:hypothetical protein
MRIVDAQETAPKKGATANYPTDPEGIRHRIEHVLALYPKLNFTMLQVGLGTGFRPFYWRPILAEMINDGTLKHWEEMRFGPTGRYNMYSFIQLSPNRRKQLDDERKAATDGQQTDSTE